MRTINEKDGYTLFGTMNTWDMNYHLVDDKGNEYLIDTDDVHDSYDDVDEYGGLLWEELKSLDDIEYIKENAWKVKEVDSILATRKTLDSITIL